MIETLIEVGKVNFNRLDQTGKSPIHIAGTTCNIWILEMIERKGGDLNLPDFEGNTFLHLICEGVVTEQEFEFIKECFQKFPDLRLIRNKNG